MPLKFSSESSSLRLIFIIRFARFIELNEPHVSKEEMKRYENPFPTDTLDGYFIFWNNHANYIMVRGMKF